MRNAFIFFSLFVIVAIHHANFHQTGNMLTAELCATMKWYSFSIALQLDCVAFYSTIKLHCEKLLQISTFFAQASHSFSHTHFLWHFFRSVFFITETFGKREKSMKIIWASVKWIFFSLSLSLESIPWKNDNRNLTTSQKTRFKV